MHLLSGFNIFPLTATNPLLFYYSICCAAWSMLTITLLGLYSGALPSKLVRDAAAALGPVSLAAHTIVKQIIDFAMAIFGCFSTVAQSLVATCLGKVRLQPTRPLLWEASEWEACVI